MACTHIHIISINHNLIERNSRRLARSYAPLCDHATSGIERRARQATCIARFTSTVSRMRPAYWQQQRGTAIDARNNAPKHTQEACKRSKYSPQVASRRVVSARVARTAFSLRKHETSIRFGHARNTGGIVATDSVSRCDDEQILLESINLFGYITYRTHVVFNYNLETFWDSLLGRLR